MGIRMESQQPIVPPTGTNLPEGAGALELVNLFDKMRTIRGFVFDVDGVFTDNTIQVTEVGELLRTMHVRDGQVVKWAIRAGLPVAIITGGRSEGTRKRFIDLGVTEYYSNIHEKGEAFTAFLQRTGLSAMNICYMGDDLPDLPVLRKVGLACAPADAVPEVLAVADYVSHLPGGHGCVRDVVEKVLKLQEKWPKY